MPSFPSFTCPYLPRGGVHDVYLLTWVSCLGEEDPRPRPIYFRPVLGRKLWSATSRHVNLMQAPPRIPVGMMQAGRRAAASAGMPPPGGTSCLHDASLCVCRPSFTTAPLVPRSDNGMSFTVCHRTQIALEYGSISVPCMVEPQHQSADDPTGRATPPYLPQPRPILSLSLPPQPLPSTPPLPPSQPGWTAYSSPINSEQLPEGQPQVSNMFAPVCAYS